MSEELNQPSSEQPKPNRPFVTPAARPSSTPPPKKNNTWIYATVIALLLGTNIYLFINRNKITEEKESLTADVTRADSSYSAVNTEYQAALARLDDLVGKNEALTQEINNKDGEVAKLKSQIDEILAKDKKTAADYAKAQRLINQLNGRVRSYEERIAELEGQNEELTNQNVTVTRERDSTTTENAGLQQKVKLGSVLHASNIRMVPIDLRRGGRKEKETGKARRVDLFRIYFDIDENRIAENGVKDLYLRITGPDGNVLSNAALGSGVTTASSGESISYTLQKQVQLAQSQSVQDISVDWKQDGDYKRGNYAIEIYNEGYRIGSGRVALR